MLEGGDGGILAGGIERLAEQKKAGGLVGDGERIAIAAIAELELALEVGAPEVVGSDGGGERGALGAPSRTALVMHQPIAVEDSVAAQA